MTHVRHSGVPFTRHIDRLVFTIRERILRGEFDAGERLTELGLVPLLGASRTPIRLALERLLHDGLLDALPAGGFRVRSFAVAEILDAIELRGVLEGTAARFAAERLQALEDLSPLKMLLREAILERPITVETFARYPRTERSVSSRTVAAREQSAALSGPRKNQQGAVCRTRRARLHRCRSR